MKYFYLITFTMIVSLTHGSTSHEFYHTIINCEQTGGEEWFEVGIVETQFSGYKVILVKHDDYDDSEKLIQNLPVIQNSLNHVDTIFEDSRGNFKLVLLENQTKADLFFKISGRDTYDIKSLSCYPNSIISFDETDL